MKEKLVWSVFWVLVLDFTIILLALDLIGYIRLPEYAYAPTLFLALLLGITLVVLTIKSKFGGWLKKSLILTGIPPIAFLIFFILGSLIIETFPNTSPIVDMIGNIIIYLLMAAFIVGAISSIVLARKTRE